LAADFFFFAGPFFAAAFGGTAFGVGSLADLPALRDDLPPLKA